MDPKERIAYFNGHKIVAHPDKLPTIDGEPIKLDAVPPQPQDPDDTLMTEPLTDAAALALVEELILGSIETAVVPSLEDARDDPAVTEIGQQNAEKLLRCANTLIVGMRADVARLRNSHSVIAVPGSKLPRPLKGW